MEHKAKKKYGQNFLKDKNLLKKIITKAEIENKNVIEVGPGQGALTQFALPVSNKMVAYEIDKSLTPYLKPFVDQGLKVIFGDFLNTDLEKDIKENFNNEDVHFIGNLPYYITSPIIFKILETEKIKTATIMIQKEVGDRLASLPNQKTYNALSVIIQHYTNVKKVMDVKRAMFFPQPKVDSIIIRIEKKDQNLGSDEDFKEFVKASFLQKRKTLMNNLSTHYKVDKTALQEFFVGNQLDLNIRAEQISVTKFEELAKNWVKFS
ncbi:Ribosomal RNA small subunit methyltransferase A [Alteracholeplasma palmae J233]|uniref:Ribosomal RNA small subunit methyltransferase A n=1 Tax=Alteracholeplasma palmae (strain ATCC 49389 / J233) TaxID=1318466 RepID=U4KJR3_ALTPJ|nr:16S rRNA (adenine(1518)-N(6)/adenine(1519)-N(6))-dimethyltransferase RsmA [Alteracholeplasma palmae]CCV63672.1 Ribosomal RNA small subunit methyltransferase A [Alteracholeplasma palmae J233]